MLVIGLCLIFVVVLLGPFLNKKIESNLEAFLFAMGVISATFSGAWNYEIVHEGLIAPINITLAVLVAGVLFHYLRKYIDHAMRRVLITVPLAAIVCVGIIFLGLFSSLISAIIAALLLVEFITVLPLHRHADEGRADGSFCPTGLVPLAPGGLGRRLDAVPRAIVLRRQ
jgi:predicted cation transporter